LAFAADGSKRPRRRARPKLLRTAILLFTFTRYQRQRPCSEAPVVAVEPQHCSAIGRFASRDVQAAAEARTGNAVRNSVRAGRHAGMRSACWIQQVTPFASIEEPLQDAERIGAHERDRQHVDRYERDPYALHDDVLAPRKRAK
jgi:hypothetical protein